MQISKFYYPDFFEGFFNIFIDLITPVSRSAGARPLKGTLNPFYTKLDFEWILTPLQGGATLQRGGGSCRPEPPFSGGCHEVTGG